VIVVPPGPFPPLGGEPQGVMDLGVRLRDQLFVGPVLRGPMRDAISGRLGRALAADEWETAGALLGAWLDTWPVGALVDEARTRWTSRPDGAALAVLGRAGELIRLAMDWGASPDGAWPWPSDAWMEGMVGTASVEAVLRRDPTDGAALVSSLFDVPLDDGAFDDLPPHAVVPGSALAARRVELGCWLARDELRAVRITGPVPNEPEAALALGEIRLEGSGQSALERWGLAGLRAGTVPAWQSALGPRPVAPVVGVLAARCQVAILPGTPDRLARGESGSVGWLLWEAPTAPVPVSRPAVAVLQAFDGEKNLDEVAASLGAPLEVVREVAAELCHLGAAGPV
jgi:hypothetical protein